MALLQMLRCRILQTNLTYNSVWVRWSITTPYITEDKSFAKMPEKTKTVREPFVKNIFIGKYDVNMLAFPEVLEPAQLNELEKRVEQIQHTIGEVSADGKRFDQFKALGLFGMQVPREYGGQHLNATEYARHYEAISRDGPLAITIAAHQAFGLKGLLTAGTQQQKQQYLPRLATGEWNAAFCYAEPQRNVHDNIETEARLSPAGDKWLIKGSKIFITGNEKADLITIIAKTFTEGYDGTILEGLTAFLVESTYGGVTFEKSVDIIGNRGAQLCRVRFDNTPVPLENLMGKVGQGYEICAEVLGSNRFNTGSFAAGVLKQFLEKVSSHCIKQRQLGKPLMDFQLIQKKVALIAQSIYILESITYLTAGIIDTVENADVTIEAAIVKVFSSETLSKCILECQSVIGTVDFLQDSTSDKVLKDSKVFMLMEGSNEVLRMYIALSGLQHAGEVIRDMVHKVRNPLMNPLYMLRKIIESKNHHQDNPKMVLGLDNFVHPSLQTSAKQLEYCVLRLQYAVEVLLTRHGRIITEKEIELNRLTDIVIGIYAMTAVIGRASRSYCIGLQDSEKEVMTAAAICQNLFEIVKHSVKLIEEGPFVSLEKSYVDIAKQVFSNKGYFFEHPLKRTFS